MKFRALALLSLLLALVVMLDSRADAAYSPPVSWLPMSMPSVTYDPVANKLAVETKPAALLGTNVNAANGQPAPGIGIFDPTKIWSPLNGAAFSRKLGWNDPSVSWPYIQDQVNSVYGFQADGVTPRGFIWIESTGKSPGLNIYLAVGMWGVNADNTLTIDYGNPTGLPYSGIFGSGGSSARWRWDAKMDHNISTVSFSYLNAASQLFTATYRLYIGDAAGTELLVNKNGSTLSSAATTTTWQWSAPLFVFTSQAGMATGVLVESNVFIVSGIPVAAPWAGSSAVAVSGGEYAISTDFGVTWGAYTSTPSTIANGNRVKVRQTSAAGPGLTTTATLAIPGIPGPGTFKVTTATAPGATTLVPDVVNSPHADAKAAIIAASLNVGFISTRQSDTVPAGSVISQLPPAGSSVILNVDPIASPNPAVDLVVSLGLVLIPVPDVAGLSQAAAEAAITSAALTVGAVSTAYSDAIPAGSIVSQNPAAGAGAPLGSAVNLVVSLGPAPMVTVPNVTGSPLTTALNTLTSAALNGTATYVNSSTVPSGNVISQNPLAGTLVVSGSTVALMVSSGPAVPNVVGLSQIAAGTAIREATLTVGSIDLANSDTVTVGSVISQNPIAGSTALPGAAVNLAVSLGPLSAGEVPSATLSDAYGLVADGAAVKVMNAAFTGLVNCNLDKSISLQGGYGDPTFTAAGGVTRLHGIMTISRGTVRVGKFVIY